MIKISNHAKETSKISDAEWRNYFSSLLYCDDAPTIETINDIEFEADIAADMLNEEVSLSEVLSSIKQLKCGKSPGPDSIGAEFYINTANEISPILKDLFNSILDAGTFPVAWDKAFYVQYIKVA